MKEQTVDLEIGEMMELEKDTVASAIVVVHNFLKIINREIKINGLNENNRNEGAYVAKNLQDLIYFYEKHEKEGVTETVETIYMDINEFYEFLSD